MKRYLLPLAAAALAAACVDTRTPLDSSLPSFAVSDGAHQGRDGFYFFPPIVPTPTFDGVFNPDVRPRVNVWGPFDSDVVAECRSHEADGAIVHFQGAAISVDLATELYSAGWQTGQSNLISEKVYRICVWARTLGEGNQVVWENFGFRDVKPEDTNQDNRSTDQAPVYGFKNGSNIPIKFRIEKGVTCAGAGVADCTEAVFDAAGGTAVCSGASCAIQVGGGVLTEEVVFQIQQVTCATSSERNPVFLENLDLPQFPGCVVVNASQSTFDPPIVVAACISPGAALGRLKDETQLRKLQLHHELPDGSIEALPSVPTAVDANCEQILADAGVFASLPSHGLWRYASAALRGLKRLIPWVDPTPAYAVDRGMGGSTGTLSPFVWALPAQMEKHSWTNPRLVRVGETHNANVLVTDSCAGVSIDGCASQTVEGARVWFQVLQGNGTLGAPVPVVSGPSGLAAMPWTFNAAGNHELEAFGYGLGVAPVEAGLPPNPFAGIGPWAIHTASGPLVDAIVPLGTGRVSFTAVACPAPLAVDGIVEAAYGAPTPFTAKLSGGSTSAWLYTYNDCDDLYVAVAVATTDASLGNSLRLIFDNTRNGPTAEDDQLAYLKDKSGAFAFEDRFLTSSCLNSKQADCGARDPIQDGAGAHRHDAAAGRFVYELRHPLKSGQVLHDFQLSFGDTVGMFLVLQLGNGAQGNTQWPGFRVFHPITIVAPTGTP